MVWNLLGDGVLIQGTVPGLSTYSTHSASQQHHELGLILQMRRVRVVQGNLSDFSKDHIRNCQSGQETGRPHLRLMPSGGPL